jgi:hypothetical protein
VAGRALEETKLRLTQPSLIKLGHGLSLAKVYSKNENFRKEREKMFINKMQTKYMGMNRKT